MDCVERSGPANDTDVPWSARELKNDGNTADPCWHDAGMNELNESTKRRNSSNGSGPTSLAKQAASGPTQRVVLDWEPESRVELHRSTFINSLRSSPRGSSAGPGGCTYEHPKLLLDEIDTTELLVAAIFSRKAKFQETSRWH